jgi:predicted nucleic acid-binding protein
MPAAPVVANNTPLVALWVLGRLDLLRELYGEVWIPPAIQDEFVATETALRLAALQNAPWIKVVPLSNPQRSRVYVGLDEGEADVLTLAEECSARLVIMDELRGRRYAQRLGLPLTGTLGLLLLGKEKGLISQLAPLLAELQNAGLYLASELIARVLALANEADTN